MFEINKLGYHSEHYWMLDSAPFNWLNWDRSSFYNSFDEESKKPCENQ